MKNFYLIVLIGLTLFGNVTDLLAQAPPTTFPGNAGFKGAGMYLFGIDENEDPSKLTSLQHGLNYTISKTTKGGGVDMGIVDYQDITITKQFDRNSIPIQELINLKKDKQFLLIGFYNEAKELRYYLALTNAYIYTYTTSTTDGCSSGCPEMSEAIAIYYKHLVIVNRKDNRPGGINQTEQTLTIDN